MHYGGDYNPEQWPRHVWTEDVALMRQAGVTMVTLGVFAWSRIQPAEGVYDWDWLDAVIDLLHENGIAVDLATATASPPPWATAAYPDMLPRDENGAVYWPGSRQAYAPASPTYRRLAGELVTELAARYVHHPGVVMWHVNNEYGCHLHYDYSDHARDAFQSWLQRRYDTVERLNEAWGTDFWSQRYTAFEQVLPPRKAPYSHNPGAVLDFKRFTSDTLLELYVMERDILRTAGATQPITTNFMGAFAPVDYWRWAEEVDVVTDDNYPDPNDPESFRGAAFARDLMRSLKPGTPWMLMEQSTNAVSSRRTNAPKLAGQMAALSAQAIGRGADAIMFFQWRQSRRGAEKFHSAMLPHSGTETRTWREVTELGAVLAGLPELPAGPSGARVALVFDWENLWAISGTDHPVVLEYAAILQRWYAALHREHVSVDIVKATHRLDDYALVVAPQLYLLTDAGASNLRAYVEQGGHLLVSAFSDVVDEHDAFRPGGFLVGLGPVLGVDVEDFGALVPPITSRAPGSAGTVAGPPGPGQDAVTVSAPWGDLRGEYFAEDIRVRDAEVVGRFTEGRNAGRAALTSRWTGEGCAHYLATIPDDAGMRRVLRWATELAGVTPEITGVDEHVEVCRRGDVLTVINHGPEPAVAKLSGTDLVTGRELGEVELAPFDWVILRDEKDVS